MQKSTTAVNDLLKNLPKESAEQFKQLHETILKNIPKGFEADISFGGIGYVVPHSIYPSGYHCKPTDPLPFAGIALRKNSINFYHMGIYADAELLNWFVQEFPKFSKQKLDMGKSCVRFKKIDDIPLTLIAKLMKKISVKDWINTYESKFKK
jgi:hypothetical protein